MTEAATEILRAAGIKNVYATVGTKGRLVLDSESKPDLLQAISFLVEGGLTVREPATDADSDGYHWATLLLPT